MAQFLAPSSFHAVYLLQFTYILSHQATIGDCNRNWQQNPKVHNIQSPTYISPNQPKQLLSMHRLNRRGKHKVNGSSALDHILHDLQNMKAAKHISVGRSGLGVQREQQIHQTHGAITAPSSMGQTKLFQSDQGCRTAVLWLPTLAFLLFGFLLLHSYVKILHMNGAVEDSQLALCLDLVYCFQDNLSWMIILIDSFQFASTLGKGAEFSGWMIGIFKVGGALGMITFWICLSVNPNIWRQGRPILFYTNVLQCLGAICSVITGWAAAARTIEVVNLQACILVARFVQGLGGGMQNSLMYNQFGHLVPASKRPAQLLSANLAQALGLGLAPICAASFRIPANLVTCEFDRDIADYEALLFTAGALPFASIYCLLFYPDLSYAADIHTEEMHTCDMERVGLRCTVVILCIVTQVGRTFSMCAWEAALTLMFELDYGFTMLQNGFTTSATCFSCLLVKLIFDRYRQAYHVNTWIRALCIAAVLGVLISRLQILWILLLASLMTFPTLFMTGGLFYGIAQNYCLPTGQPLDLKTTTLVIGLCSDVLGRGFAPAASRLALERSFSVWWLCQLCVVVFSSVSAEIVFCLQALEDRLQRAGAASMNDPTQGVRSNHPQDTQLR